MGPSRPLWPMGPSMPGSPKGRNSHLRVRALCHGSGLRRLHPAGRTPAWSLHTGLPAPPLTPHSPGSTQKLEQPLGNANGPQPLLPQTCKWFLNSLGGKAEVLPQPPRPHKIKRPTAPPPDTRASGGLRPGLPPPPHCSLTTAHPRPRAWGRSLGLECFPPHFRAPAPSLPSSLFKPVQKTPSQ